jgi:hypothetical protein
MLNGTTEGEAAMSRLAIKDDLKASVADLEDLCALQVWKLTLRFGLMMAAFVLIVYAMHLVL